MLPNKKYKIAAIWQGGLEPEPPQDGTPILALFNGMPHVVSFETGPLLASGYNSGWRISGGHKNLIREMPDEWAYIIHPNGHELQADMQEEIK